MTEDERPETAYEYAAFVRRDYDGYWSWEVRYGPTRHHVQSWSLVESSDSYSSDGRRYFFRRAAERRCRKVIAARLKTPREWEPVDLKSTYG
jgi:hypothetical protein